MESKARAQVCWIFANEDAPVAEKLLLLASVLEAQGLIQSWTFASAALEIIGKSTDPLLAQEQETNARIETLRRADVVMVLCSNALFHGPPEAGWKLALSIVAQGQRARVVPVILSPTILPPELATFQPLPRDGQPVIARRGRDEALLEVIQGLQETITFRPVVTPVPDEEREPLGVPVGYSVGEIFRLHGPPEITFVEPPDFTELKHHLRTMGSGLIVEGPSKVGKSTAIKKAMQVLGVPVTDQIWWHGQEPPPLDEVRRTLHELLRIERKTWLFIDDFHHLEDEHYRRTLAAGMKILADQDVPCAKVTLVGINPLGSSLVQVMPDLSGRFRILRLDVEKGLSGSKKIAELITLGELAANIRFKRRDEFVVAAAGSFYFAQYLCCVAAVKAGIVEAQRDLVEIDLGPVDVIAAIQGELAARFRVPVIDFASFDAAPSPRGAGLSLLWLLGRSGDGFVSVKEARLRFPMLAAAFEWFLASNLKRCFEELPHLKGLLYYNRATQTLTMEDPQLRFYLRELDWEELAEASGHGHVRFHPEDGPLWAIAGLPGAMLEPASITSAGFAAAPRQARRLLHLSDLHFTTKDQATVWYSQLAADLREQQVDRLDALVVSGDLVDRADPIEYDAARLFLEKLMSGFALSARQVVLVPGNHDASWSVSEAAYVLHRRTQYSGTLAGGAYIVREADIIEVREDEAYCRRFQPFAALYRAIKGVDYPLAYEEQGTIDDLSDLGICILGLNSAWEIDHHFGDRASIHPGALANALLRLGTPSTEQLRIAVFHHPIHSGEESRLRDEAFLQQLAVHGFRVVLHGHVHMAGGELYRYGRGAGSRKIEIVAAGTFGAPTKQWVPGYPLQYNLLLVGPDRITVETRCRREVNGAWQPDARWLQGPGQPPLPHYAIER